LVPRSPSLRDVDDAGRKMGDEEGKQYDGYPKLLQSDLADLRLVRRKVVRERSRPDLGAKVAGRADEEACEDQSLCTPSDIVLSGFLADLPVGPLK
jgi:hypothetical protein